MKDIETFIRQHRFQVFFCLAFVLGFFFALIMYSAWWSVFGVAVGASLGTLFPGKIATLSHSIFHFFQKQESTTQLVLGIVLLIIAIFLAPLLFLAVGAHGGKEIYERASKASSDR